MAEQGPTVYKSLPPDSLTNRNRVQCRFRDAIDPYAKYFLYTYVIVLALLLYKKPMHYGLIYSIVSTIGIAWIYTCSPSASMFVRAAEPVFSVSALLLIGTLIVKYRRCVKGSAVQ